MDSFQGLTSKGPSSWYRSLAPSVNIFDHIDQTLKRDIDYAARGRHGETCVEKAWNIIKELAQYEEEGKNENLYGTSSNDLGCFPPEPSHQEAFE
nr:hypothetical protein [Tanacetum cinerariifolium]